MDVLQDAQERFQAELGEAQERIGQLEGELAVVKQYARDAAEELQSEAMARERGADPHVALTPPPGCFLVAV